MDALSATLAGLLCAAQPSALPDTVAQWQPLIAEASNRFGVPRAWIARVILLESGGQTTLNGRPITSSAGAMGLMQIMPATFAALRLRYGLGADAYNPHDNILAGTAYLRELYQRYGYPNLFAAYNAGPGRLEASLAGRRALPAVTTAYVATLTGTKTPPPDAAKPTLAFTPPVAGSALFFVNRAGQSAPDSRSPTAAVFVPLSTTAR